MSSFSPTQLKKLTSKLDWRHVQSRMLEERQIDYIEGWFAVSEANSIFGFSGWDRHTQLIERIFERARGEVTHCTYLARVCIQVRAGGGVVWREGTGTGSAASRNPAEAHDRAIKAAETDATKRALSTFGNRFGLCLYDRERRGVEGAPHSLGAKDFKLIAADGILLDGTLSAEGFCTGLRKLVDVAAAPQEVDALKLSNAAELEKLRSRFPKLCNRQNIHYADLLLGLMQRRSDRLTKAQADPPSQSEQHQEIVESAGEAAPISVEAPTGHPDAEISEVLPAEAVDTDPLPASRITGAPRVNKSRLAIATPRRLRAPDHLRAVRKLPCLICDRAPCHAHHVKFAQRSGLSIKVSDEFVVPLCSVHHDELHRSVTERAWWEGQGIDPLPIAERLWHNEFEQVT